MTRACGREWHTEIGITEQTRWTATQWNTPSQRIDDDHKQEFQKGPDLLLVDFRVSQCVTPLIPVASLFAKSRTMV